MLIHQELLGRSIIATPHACLEWTTTGPRDIYLLYDQAYYSQSSTSDGWWQRSLALDPYHSLRLSGSADTSPWDAMHAILRQPHRPAISLPALIVALFLARSDDPNTAEQRHLFRWVAAAIPELRTGIPGGSLQAEWDKIPVNNFEHLVPIIINVLLQYDQKVPWALSDSVWLQTLDHLGNALWRFPPYTTREITASAATHLEQMASADEESELSYLHIRRRGRWSAIGYLSAIRFWREPWPTIRKLPIQLPMLEFLELWHQALVIMHPEAPAISDTNFSWLCNGMIGGANDGPFDSLFVDNPDIEAFGRSAVEWQQQIAMLKQEAARGTCRPRGCWEVAISSRWPILSAYSVATMRVVAGSKGCWVRLIPAGTSWGSVLWWRPEKCPPTCWALALDEALSSVQVLALHETLWQMWRDLRVNGYLTGANDPRRL